MSSICSSIVYVVMYTYTMGIYKFEFKGVDNILHVICKHGIQQDL